MIARLSYVICDRCNGHPAQPGEGATEARGIARSEGYTRQDGQDVCGRCSGTVDERGWPVTPPAAPCCDEGMTCLECDPDATFAEYAEPSTSPAGEVRDV